MKGILNGLLTVTGAAAAAVGVLAGVERLLHNPTSPNRTRRVKPSKPLKPSAPEIQQTAPATPIVPPPAPMETKSTPERNFSIKRTKSEVGYVYWILEGYGKYKCFVLCDSWDEAVAQAKTRMAEIDALTTTPQPVSAST